VSANVSGRDLGSVVDALRDRIRAGVELPPEYRVEYGGQAESQAAGVRQIAIAAVAALALMILALFGALRSWRMVAQALINVPLALVGSVIAVMLTGGVVSMATLVGFVTLCGIASRNTIMMLNHYVHLVREEGEQFGEQMIIRGSLERLVPVLMTALTAGLALIPLVVTRHAPGKEILYPVAVVILGGLVSSTLLDMIVTPAVFFRFGRRALEDLARAEREDPLATRPALGGAS
jgi:Cu/Ag efflux pump CusA